MSVSYLLYNRLFVIYVRFLGLKLHTTNFVIILLQLLHNYILLFINITNIVIDVVLFCNI